MQPAVEPVALLREEGSLPASQPAIGVRPSASLTARSALLHSGQVHWPRILADERHDLPSLFDKLGSIHEPFLN